MEVPPIIISPPVYHATIEYGEPDLITDNAGPLWAYIRFPVAGSQTDVIVEGWAREAYVTAYNEISGLRTNDPEAEGEINVQFDSFLVEDRYAGVLENGMFMSTHLAHPTSVIHTFNIDTKSDTLLQNADILDYSQLESIYSLLQEKIVHEYPETSDMVGEIDEEWLEHIVVGHGGIIVVLDRGVFLPAYLGVMQITLPYDELGTLLVLGNAPAVDPPPSATPSATPTEQPSATPSEQPSATPTEQPSATPTQSPSATPTQSPSVPPTEQPSATPTEQPSATPSESPATTPTESPATPPSESPSATPTQSPSATPTESPTAPPTQSPSATPTPIPNVPPQTGDVDPSKPMVALTFDDGPSKYTSQILSILEKYGARATFCVVGNLVNARKETVKRASDLGCEIIGHSWDHRDLTKLTAEEVKKELRDTSAVIESVTGVSPRLYRPPYGAVNNTLKSISAELGYALINWSVDPLDWQSRNADKVYNAIMADTGNRAIVLSHDLYGSTADAMERVIPELISRGYQLVTVSELMYYSGKTFEPGVVYHHG